MKLLELLIQEYLSIIKMLEEKKGIENDRIIIDREYFKSLLSKYGYMKYKDKAKAYRDLNLILHDKNSYTMPYKDKETKKTIRKVVLNYTTYNTIKYLYETNIS